VPETEKKPRGRPTGELTAFGQWLKGSQDWDKAKLAEALGRGTSYINHLSNGRRTPDKVLALAIEHVTSGAFKVEQWEKLSDSE